MSRGELDASVVGLWWIVMPYSRWVGMPRGKGMGVHGAPADDGMVHASH